MKVTRNTLRTVGADREAERVAATITGIRKRAQRLALLDKILTGALHVIFILLGVFGMYMGFEMAAMALEVWR